MPRIFGINVAGIVHSSTRGQLFAGTLSRRTVGSTKNYAFEGVAITESESQNIQALSKIGYSSIMIIAESISPKTMPRVRDELLLNSKKYSVLAVETDPAEATHICSVSTI